MNYRVKDAYRNMLNEDAMAGPVAATGAEGAMSADVANPKLGPADRGGIPSKRFSLQKRNVGDSKCACQKTKKRCKKCAAKAEKQKQSVVEALQSTYIVIELEESEEYYNFDIIEGDENLVEAQNRIAVECAWCKKDLGTKPIDREVKTDPKFGPEKTHTICPDCYKVAQAE